MASCSDEPDMPIKNRPHPGMSLGYDCLERSGLSVAVDANKHEPMFDRFFLARG